MRRTRVYWRPSHVPTPAMLALLLAAIAALLAVESFTRQGPSPHYEQMISAARRVHEGMRLVPPIRGEIEPVNPDVDPQRSGLIGVASSSVTSNSGHLESKQATINPNWAALVVDLLRQAEVREGDAVAVAVSGSFPALNLAVYAAIEELGADPLVITSGSSSQWGANVPGMLWVDLARHLREAGVLRTRAIAASLGGREDRGLGLSRQGIESIRNSIERAGLELLEPQSYEEAVALRITTYTRAAGNREIRALVNVGGGTATTGPDAIDHHFSSGFQTSAPPRAFAIPSVMGHFLNSETPVIHFSGISTLARRHGLPYPLERTPTLGEGEVYQAVGYRRWLSVALIVALLAMTWFVVRSATGRSALGSPRNDPTGMQPKV